VRLYGAVETVRETRGTSLSPIDRGFSARSVEAVRCQLPESVFTDQWLAGQAMSLEQAIEVARQFIVQEQVTSPPRSPEGSVSHDALTSPPSEKLFGLTAREVEVLRLLTQGLTYAQIAQQLVISTRTADAHLRSIYGKLGVTSRSAATRYAIEHKLV
jgi:DNA-binding NarL/FixJ family response regulator